MTDPVRCCRDLGGGLSISVPRSASRAFLGRTRVATRTPEATLAEWDNEGGFAGPPAPERRPTEAYEALLALSGRAAAAKTRSPAPSPWRDGSSS